MTRNNNDLFAEDMMKPIQEWVNKGACPYFIAACLRQFAHIIEQRALAEGIEPQEGDT
jgi:hypothetical protein